MAEKGTDVTRGDSFIEDILLRKMEILRNTEDLRNKFIIDIIKYNLKYQYLTMNMIHNIIILP